MPQPSRMRACTHHFFLNRITKETLSNPDGSGSGSRRRKVETKGAGNRDWREKERVVKPRHGTIIENCFRQVRTARRKTVSDTFSRLTPFSHHHAVYFIPYMQLFPVMSSHLRLTTADNV